RRLLHDDATRYVLELMIDGNPGPEHINELVGRWIDLKFEPSRRTSRRHCRPHGAVLSAARNRHRRKTRIAQAARVEDGPQRILGRREIAQGQGRSRIAADERRIGVLEIETARWRVATVYRLRRNVIEDLEFLEQGEIVATGRHDALLAVWSAHHGARG